MTLPSRRRSGRSPRRVLPTLALLGSLALSQVGHAEEDSVTQFNEAQIAAAPRPTKSRTSTRRSKTFQQAYALKPEPLLFFNIAQCYRKINHDAEAITFYQSYLRRPETTDPELRAKAERYLAELQGRHVAQPRLVYVESAHEPRPWWRLGLGIGLLAGSSVLLGIGGRALDVNGRCVDTYRWALKCSSVADTQGLGIGLVSAGAILQSVASSRSRFRAAGIK